MTAAEFRANFPAFADEIKFPDAQVNFWLALGVLLLRPEAWVDVLDYGLQLFMAHNLAVEATAGAAAAAGNIPGLPISVVSSKSVDKLSVSYDTGIGLNPDAGPWNLTIWGQQFYNLMRIAGMGATQLGAGSACYVALGYGALGWPYG